MARLPNAVRTALNQRLRDGETGTDSLKWLNGLPEVQQMKRHHFAGAALTDCNLSRWSDGGYKDWLAEERAREDALALAHRAAALEGFSLGTLTKTWPW